MKTYQKQLKRLLIKRQANSSFSPHLNTPNASLHHLLFVKWHTIGNDNDPQMGSYAIALLYQDPPTGWARGKRVVGNRFLLVSVFLAINAHSMAWKCNEQWIQKTGWMRSQVQCLWEVQIWRSFRYQQDVSPCRPALEYYRQNNHCKIRWLLQLTITIIRTITGRKLVTELPISVEDKISSPLITWTWFNGLTLAYFPAVLDGCLQ